MKERLASGAMGMTERYFTFFTTRNIILKIDRWLLLRSFQRWREICETDAEERIEMVGFHLFSRWTSSYRVLLTRLLFFIDRIFGRFSVQKEKLQNQGPQRLRISAAGKTQGRSLHRKILERDERKAR